MNDSERRNVELEDAFGEGLHELPPNIPPGFLGEVGPDLRKADTGGPYGLNAGVVQEWTWETTMILVGLAYIFFFPAAFVVLWRSRKVPKRQKVVLTVLMLAGLAYVAWRVLAG